MLGAIGSALGGSVGGFISEGAGAFLGYKGVKDTNDANQAIAAARNQFEMQEAEKARTFSATQQANQFKYGDTQARLSESFAERMSNTAVQRRMADMKKAGINPILAGKFDASSPAGSMGAGGIGGTAKASAHGYTAQNKLQGALDNLSTALAVKKLFYEAEKAKYDSGISKNKEGMSALPGELGKDVGDIYKGVTDNFGKWARHEYNTTAKGLKNVGDKIQRGTIEQYNKFQKAYDYWQKNGKDTDKAFEYYKGL